MIVELELREQGSQHPEQPQDFELSLEKPLTSEESHWSQCDRFCRQIQAYVDGVDKRWQKYEALVLTLPDTANARSNPLGTTTLAWLRQCSSCYYHKYESAYQSP